VAAVQSGFQAAYQVFPDWGGAPPEGWLAPFAPTPFRDHCVSYMSAEHWMMHAKAKLFGDEDIAEKILRARTPMQAQELGRRAQGFSESVWIVQRETVMFNANLAKFSTLAALRDYLLLSWPKILVLASPNDIVWGSGLDLADPMLSSPSRWPGLNLGGFSLMRVCEHLRLDVERFKPGSMS
jgi:ribA/ribD-fused uncharacterized protein